MLVWLEKFFSCIILVWMGILWLNMCNVCLFVVSVVLCVFLVW